MGVPWGDDPRPLVKTLQAMVAGIVAARGTKAQSTGGDNRAKTLEERLDAFSIPLSESKRYAKEEGFAQSKRIHSFSPSCTLNTRIW